MNVKKFCTIYVGIGIIYAGTMFAKIKKDHKEEFARFSTEAKINAFTEEVLTWPIFVMRLIKANLTGIVDGIKDGINDMKESTNESDT